MSKIIKAVFTGRFCTCKRVFQWDTDDKLQFVNLDLPQNYTVDFANSLTGQSVPVLATSDTVQIPPDMFVPGSEIYAWVWISDTNGGHTRCQATIPIDPRAQRSGASPTPAQASAWDQAVQTLNDAAADYETAISHAPIIQNGYWFIWDSTAGEYVTTDVKAEGVDGQDGAGVWYTTDHIFGDENPFVSRRSLIGREGATVQVHDLLFAPDIGYDGAPTTLYEITSVGIACLLNRLCKVQGEPGEDGDAATISVGTTTTLAAGSDATVSNSGTSGAAVFNFGIPKGDTGATGATGPAGPGMTDDFRAAILQLASKVAYIDDGGADYYQDLYDALYPPANVVSISAVYTQSGTVYENADLDDLRDDLVVTAHYDDNTDSVVNDYTLSGYLTVGTSTVTVAYQSKTTTFTVTVTERPTLSSISAVYTQSGTVWSDDALDSLKSGLVVTASYSDSTTQTVAAEDYTLSGTLDSATSTITVSYGGKTATFTVAVTLVGSTNYAGDLSTWTLSGALTASYSDGKVTLKYDKASDFNSNNYSMWAFDPKNTLWSAVVGKKLRFRVTEYSPDWTGEFSDTTPNNRVIDGIAIFQNASVTTGGGRQRWATLGTRVLNANPQTFEYVIDAELSTFTGGTATPTAQSTFGYSMYNASLNTVVVTNLEIVEVLN